MSTGAIMLVLHAHLPFVRHPENDYHLEENWLFEAISETYIPILQSLDRLERDNVPGTITISLSAPLIAMLDDGLLRERTQRYLRQLMALCEKERVRTSSDPRFSSLAAFYDARFRDQLAYYEEELDRDLVGRFVHHHRTGRVQLITCVGTHGFAPLMLRDASRRGQVLSSARAFEARVGFPSTGMWMGECAYRQGFDRFLREAGVAYSYVDSHSVAFASATSQRGVYAPIVAPSGVAFFARDPESSKQVWSSTVGYPGDAAYREFYRDVGFDLDLDYIAPFIHPDGIRVHTGVKYYRVTGHDSTHKEPYHPETARQVAHQHARHFVQSRAAQIERLSPGMDVPPLIVCPYDAELFGHWWFEGPIFLEEVMRAIANETSLHACAADAYLRAFPDQSTAEPADSSWGDGGDYRVWLNHTNSWIYRELHECESLVAELTRAAEHGTPEVMRARKQACRELMLAQSSDWAFILNEDSLTSYAIRRIVDHCEGVRRLATHLRRGEVEAASELAQAYYARNPIFPALDPLDWR